MRHGTPRPSATLLAATLASAALMAAGCGSSKDKASTATSSTPAVATTTTPAATTTTPPAETTASPPAAPPPSSSTKHQGTAVKGSANGRTYRCLGASLLHDLRVLNGRIVRGRKTLKRIRKELRTLKRRYPNNVAPPAVAQRYNYLVRTYNALLRQGNRRVRAYNRRLNRDCFH